MIKTNILDPRISLPRRFSASVSYDLHLCSVDGQRISEDSHWSEYLLHAGETVRIGTGIAFQLSPDNICGLIIPMPALWHQKLSLAYSPVLIDPNYQGEVQVYLHNYSSKAVELAPLLRVAQILFVQPYLHEFIQTPANWAHPTINSSKP